MHEGREEMKYILRAFALLCLAGLVFGQSSGNVNFEPPTQYTDGSQLLEQDIDFYTLYCNGAAFVEIDSIIGTYSATVDVRALGVGTHSCHLTTVMLSGAESAPSNVVDFTVGPRVPRGPVLVTIQLQ